MKTIIVDGNNMGFMAFAIAPLTNDGERVEAIYVGLNMIRSYLQRFEPDRMYVTWDGGRDPERLARYPEYKQRTKELTPDEARERSSFFRQMRGLREVIGLLGIAQYKLNRREADDVIYNLIGPAKDEDGYIVVSTDKDFYQLLERRDVEIYNPVTKEIIRAAKVEARFGIPVCHFLKYKALIGDPSDNLPGVKGIGPKRAAWLINDVFSLDPGGEAIGKVKFTESQMKIINLLDENMDTFSLMHELIKLKRIGSEEMEKGRFENDPTDLTDLQERAIMICVRHNFEKHQRNFPDFIRPFELFYRKQGDQ